MVMIMFRSPADTSNDIYVSIEKDYNGVEQILATGHQHSSINNRIVNPSEQFTTNSCKRSRVHSETYLKVFSSPNLHASCILRVFLYVFCDNIDIVL